MKNEKLVYVSKEPRTPKKVQDRINVLQEDPDWIRAYDTLPEDGQSVYYTFPTMSNTEFTGKFIIDKELNINFFMSKHGFLGDEDVYWQPMSYEYNPEEDNS